MGLPNLFITFFMCVLSHGALCWASLPFPYCGVETYCVSRLLVYLLTTGMLSVLGGIIFIWHYGYHHPDSQWRMKLLLLSFPPYYITFVVASLLFIFGFWGLTCFHFNGWLVFIFMHMFPPLMVTYPFYMAWFETTPLGITNLSMHLHGPVSLTPPLTPLVLVPVFKW